MVILTESNHSADVLPKLSTPRRVSASSAPEESNVDFDHYMIVYTDYMDRDDAQLPRLAPIIPLMLGHNTRSPEDECSVTGETTIGCYQGNRFVGSIDFYSNPERHPPSSVDSEGLIHLWFPLPCLPHILSTLYHERNLTLSLIRADLNGRVFSPAIGALLTWPERTGRKALGKC